MSSLLAKRKPHRFVILRKRRGVNNQVDFWIFFVALPKTNLVIDEINACGAFRHLIGPNHFMQIEPDFGRSVGHGQMNDGGVLFQAAPVALVSKSLAVEDAQGSKEAPATE